MSACGPRALHWVAARLGLPLDPGRVEQACKYQGQPLSLLEIKKAAESLGLLCSAQRLSWSELRRLDQPAILFVDMDHFIAADPRDDRDTTRLRIYDSDSPTRTLRAEELAARWQGVTLVVARGGRRAAVHGARIDLDRCIEFAGMLPVDRVAQASFTIRNLGDTALELRDLQSHCSCTAAGLPEHPVAPGDSAVVSLQVDLSQKRGPFVEGVRFRTNDTQAPEVELSIEGEAYNPNGSLPPRLFLGTLVQGDSTGGTLLVRDPGDGSMQDVRAWIDDASTSKPAAHAIATLVRVHPLDAASAAFLRAREGDFAVEVRVRAGATAPLGPFRNQLEVRARSSAPLHATVPIEGRIASRIRCEPAALVLRPESGRPERLVKLSDANGGRLDVQRVQVVPEGALVVVPVATAGLSGFSLRVALPENRGIQKPVDAEIICILTGQERVAIPVMILPN